MIPTPAEIETIGVIVGVGVSILLLEPVSLLKHQYFSRF